MSLSNFFPALLIVASLVSRGSAECPANHEEIPTLYDDDTFNCFMLWQGPGDSSPLNSCIQDCEDNTDGVAGGILSVHGDDVPGENDRWYAIGSYLVKPGCQVTWWKDNNYNGDWGELPGLVLNPKMEFGKNDLEWCWDWGWGSFKCRCQMSMPDCTPVDGWDTILVCDNVNGVEDLACTYQQSIGTVYSESTSESMGIDETISETISAGLFNLFNTEIGISLTTEYDWTQTSELTMSEVDTITVEAVAPAGYTLYLEQAVGQCGDDQPRTEMFKATNLNKAGTVVSVEYERRGDTSPPTQSPHQRLEAAKRGASGKWNRGNHTLKAVPAFYSKF